VEKMVGNTEKLLPQKFFDKRQKNLIELKCLLDMILYALGNNY